MCLCVCVCVVCAACRSLLMVRCVLAAGGCSLCAGCCAVFDARCSVFVAWCLLFADCWLVCVVFFFVGCRWLVCLGCCVFVVRGLWLVVLVVVVC